MRAAQVWPVGASSAPDLKGGLERRASALAHSFMPGASECVIRDKETPGIQNASGQPRARDAGVDMCQERPAAQAQDKNKRVNEGERRKQRRGPCWSGTWRAGRQREDAASASDQRCRRAAFRARVTPVDRRAAGRGRARRVTGEAGEVGDPLRPVSTPDPPPSFARAMTQAALRCVPAGEGVRVQRSGSGAQKDTQPIHSNLQEGQ